MNDDILTLYYYDDGLTAQERREVEAALAADPELAARYDVLRRQLRALGELSTTEAAPAHSHARWHASIERAARQERYRSADRPRPDLFHIPSFFWGAAITAALVAGIAIGFMLPDGGTPDGPAPRIAETATDPDRGATAFSRGLQVHLRESRNDIAELAYTAGADRALLILQIVEQNRLFERAADQRNSPEVARVLRAIEPVLLRLADDDISPAAAEALREQLAFELNVMLTKLSRDVSEESHSI